MTTKKQQKPNMIHYVHEYVIEEGIQKFRFPTPQTFVCTLKTPHFVKAHMIFLSDKQQGAFIYCRKHNDFFDVSYPE